MKSKAIRICLVVLAAYLLLGAGFYFIAGDSLHATSNTTETVTAKASLGEFTAGEKIRQSFVCEFDELTSISFLVGTNARENNDLILVELLDENGQAVMEPLKMATAKLKDNAPYTLVLPTPITEAREQRFTLQLTSRYGAPKNAICFYYGNSVDTGRFDFSAQISEEDALYVFEGDKFIPFKDTDGNICQLCLSLNGTNNHWFGEYYWFLYAGAGLLLLLFLGYQVLCLRRGKHTLTLAVANSIRKYSFLIRQLVSRDFKSKYKRSVLGMLWSFLNPLLTMSIQYVVFSTIFQSTIPNLIIYLLTGIICFNFFSEATSMCLMSIIGNASLINKVYVPKYIYPFSRTISSGINLLLSLVPLLIMLLITRTPITPAILLLPFALLMLFLLSYGVGLLLATMMVFFRDTQFLWNIFSMLLMYMTPIFYPDNIIPDRFMSIYKLNPLYHVIRFMRSILIDGVSLEPKAYLWCAVLCLIPFLIGLVVFRKNEDKFVLNI